MTNTFSLDERRERHGRELVDLGMDPHTIELLLNRNWEAWIQDGSD